MTFHRATAYHEAGHVVACCRLLHGIHYARACLASSNGSERVRVRSLGCTLTLSLRQQTPDDFLFTAGVVEPRRPFNKHVRKVPLAKYEPDENRRRVFMNGFSDIMMSLAGPFAEARYTRRKAATVMLTNGIGDVQDANAVATFLAGDDKTVAQDILNHATERAQVLVRRDWQKIVAVAEKLASKGVIQGDDALLQDIEQIDFKRLRLLRGTRLKHLPAETRRSNSA